MSDTDSFIDEVTEEVQRDKLFAAMRKYGWIAILAVLLLVGGAAWNEWRKARDTAAAEALGDGIMAAIQGDGPVEGRIAALTDLQPGGDADAVVALIAAAQEAEDDARPAAIARLKETAAQPGLPVRYSHLALLKASMLEAGTAAPETRIAELSGLTAPGAPYRALAEEQIALAEVEQGKSAEAIDRLKRISADAAASEGLRRRATQLIVALGGDPAGE